MTILDNFDRRLPRQIPVERNPVLNGIADLRSAIQRANAARSVFDAHCRAVTMLRNEELFGALEAAYLDTANDVRDALGALGMTPGEINALGEVLS